MESIKEKLPMIIALALAILICILAYYFLDYHKEIFYTQIDNSRIEKISSKDNMKYEYTLECFNERGKKKELKFKTSRELKEDAYLMLELRTMGVHSWEEITYDKLPEKVKVNYNE